MVKTPLKLLGEKRAIPVGFGFQALGFLGFALASEGWQLILAIVPFSLGAIGSVALRSYMTKQVSANQQGELQGAIASIMGLGAIALAATCSGDVSNQVRKPHISPVQGRGSTNPSPPAP